MIVALKRWLLAAIIVLCVLGIVWVLFMPKPNLFLKRRLEFARQQWQEQQIADYRMTVRNWPWGKEYRLTVQSGKVVEAEARLALLPLLGAPPDVNFEPVSLDEAAGYTVEGL